MEDNFKKRFFRLYKFLTSRVVYHTGFWLGLFFLLLLIEQHEGEWLQELLKQLGQIFFFMALVYTNIYVLVPRYLSQNRLFIYLSYLISLTLLVTFARIVFQYWLYSGNEAEQFSLLHEAQPLIFILHLFIAIASTIFVISFQWVRNEREKKELLTQQMQTELKFLKSQINPHFLFNILNSLYALTLKKSDLAPDMVIKLSEMMRYMLYECNERIVPLEKEINYLRNYLDLERHRIGNKMEITLEVNGDMEDKYIAPLIFINFVENSFKHGGIMESGQKGWVRLTINIDEKDIHFKLENSKAFRLKETKELMQSGGIGLKNVRDRLNLVYGINYDLEITDGPEVYSVNLKLQLDSK